VRASNDSRVPSVTRSEAAPGDVQRTRRRFDHLFEEISVRIGRLAPRYALWLRLRELGMDADALSRDDVMTFCSDHLAGFLHEYELALAPRQARDLLRCVARHDPALRTPAEWLASR
jgi:hypothetical protein